MCRYLFCPLASLDIYWVLSSNLPLLLLPLIFSALLLSALPSPTGDVVITDLGNASDITRRRVDHAGARQVRYTRAGVVVALGQSCAGQVLLWDPRTSSSSSTSAEVSCFQRPLVNGSRGLGVADKDSYLTCLETHPSNEHELYCGTSTGELPQTTSYMLWRRVESSSVMHPHTRLRSDETRRADDCYCYWRSFE